MNANTKPLVIALLLVPLVCAAVAADKAPPAPDPEMLEFLGTYETADGKGIDPFLLEQAPGKPEAVKKKGERRPAPPKPAQKKSSPSGREQQDE